MQARDTPTSPNKAQLDNEGGDEEDVNDIASEYGVEPDAADSADPTSGGTSGYYSEHDPGCEFGVTDAESSEAVSAISESGVFSDVSDEQLSL